MTLDTRLQAAPGKRGVLFWKMIQRQTVRLRALHQRARQRVFGATFSLCRQSQQFIGSDACVRQHNHIGQFGPAACNGPGLIEKNGLHSLNAFQTLATFDEDALFRSPARADHNGRRRRQSQRAGAGHHQHGNGCDQRHNPGRVCSIHHTSGSNAVNQVANNRPADKG